jgi:polar amino acid transport system permease protein
MMVVQYFVERHFGRGYGQAGRARLRLRDLSAEKGTVTEGPP